MNLKNKKVWLIGLFVVIAVVLATIVVVKLLKNNEMIDPGKPIDNPPEDTRSIAEKIIIESYSIGNTSKNRDVRTSIPKIMNLDDKRFQEYINKKILQVVMDYQNEIEVMVDDETPADTLYKYVVSYNQYANDRFVSLIVNNNYQTGGMRSNSWKDTYNIDATKGANKEVFLKDLFSPEVDYKAAILDEINSQADEKGYELVGGNGLSNLADLQKFYIKDGKLVIYFDPAAIAPYVYGELNFEMPFSYSEGVFHI